MEPRTAAILGPKYRQPATPCFVQSDEFEITSRRYTDLHPGRNPRAPPKETDMQPLVIREDHEGLALSLIHISEPTRPY